MSSSAQSPAHPPAALLLPLVLLLFVASGCAALIYEVVWYQLLALAIGSSAISLGILLATFMGGLCLGSWLLPRFARPSQHPLRVYAVIEAGIGLFGLAVLWGLPLTDSLYVAAVQLGLPGLPMRALLAALMLLPPTMLMGASLPAISRFIAATPRGVTWWGWLYAGNTVGAVVGCILAGFVLLRLTDQAVATYVAVAINAVTAIASLALAKAAPAVSVTVEETQQVVPAADEAAQSNVPVYWAIGISGAAALGMQVVWTRFLAMLFGQTVYAFSAILAVFLAGLAIGGAVGALLLRWIKPRPALAWSQLLLAGAIAYAAYMITQVLPFLPELRTLNGWEMAFTDLRRATLAILPGALLWGASFPFALAAAGRGSRDPAGPVARVYAANTFGAILGAILTSLVLIGGIGTRDTQRVLLVLVAVGGLVLLLPMLKRQKGSGGAIAGAGLAAALVAVGALTLTLPEQPGELVAFGHQIPSLSSGARVIEVAEGRTSSIAITRVNDGNIQISVGGHVEATSIPFDMSLQRMMTHIPSLLHPNPQKVLNIGFGAGVTAGSYTFHPSVKSITVVELEPKVPPLSAKWFGAYNNNVRSDPRTRIIFDDGRHFMMTTKETFDIIASDPIDVWVKGTAGIYSADYFRKVKERLNPGGYFTLYVPLYESSEETIRTEFATFFEAFPNATVWANLANGYGYDLVLMGPKDPGPLKVDIDLVEKRLHEPRYAPLARSLAFIGFPTATSLYATYLGDHDSMKNWLAGAQLNTDRNMRLQYVAGWAIYSDLADPLYRKIVAMRKPPKTYFTGSPERLSQLYGEMQAPQPFDADLQ